MAIGTILSPASWVNGTVVPPQWLQQVQDNLNGFIAGTGPTIAALQIDGVGDSASTQPAGSLAISALGTSASIPTAARLVGTMYKDQLVFAMVVFSSNGGAPSVSRAFNIAASPVRSSAGVYNFGYVTNSALGSSLVGVATLAGGSVTPGFIAINPSSIASFDVKTFNTGGTAADLNTSVVAFVFGS